MNEFIPSERFERARGVQRSWAALSIADRCVALGNLRRQIAQDRESIVDAICADTGKSRLDALAGDILVTLEQLRYYESNAARILAKRSPGKPSFFWAGARFEESYEPHGVALIFGPSNYPFQLSVVPVITALVAGNVVILKCSERARHTAAIIRKICARAGLEENLVQVTDEEPARAAALLEGGPDIVFFTGSCEHGRAVAARAAEKLIPTVMELGGKDAALVFADSNWERTVEGVTYGAFSNAGQVCVGIKRLYVERAIYEPFVRALVERVAQLRIGAGEESDMGILQGAEARERLLSQIEDALRRGATLHHPARPAITGAEPVLLGEVPPDARLLAEESFGPVVCIDAFDNEEEAVRVANDSSFALSCSIWTRDLARGRRVAAQMTAGTCAINDVIRNIANPHAAFGGNRHSGFGRYHGPEGLRAFSRVKSVMIVKGRTTRERAWFPFSGRTYKQLSALLALRHSSGGWARRFGRLLFPLALLLLLPSGLTAQGHACDLKIQVSLPPGSNGQVGYLVFGSGDGFPGDTSKAVRRGFVAAPAGSSSVTIDTGKLPAGTYAVSVYQDVNGNRKLDHGLFGIPREPVGVSNNPHPHVGPPKFQESSFKLSGDKTLSIHLVKP